MQTATMQAERQQADAHDPGQSALVEVATTSPASLMLTGSSMDRMMKLAEYMATGTATLPNEYRNKPGDCLAIVMQAVQWGMNPYAVAQKTFFISGKIGYEAQLVHAAILASGIITDDGFEYEWYGPWEKVIGKYEEKTNGQGVKYRKLATTLQDEIGVGIKIRGTFRKTGTVRELDLLLSQAGVRNSTLWADDPRQQLAYLAEKRWARLYAPHVILGVYTKDELEEVVERDITGQGEVLEGAGKATAKDALRGAATRGQQPPVTLQNVKDAIAKAVTPAEMKAASNLALDLTTETDRQAARASYQARVEELRSKQTAQTDTAQSANTDQTKPEERNTAPTPTYAQIEAAMLRAAKANDREMLDVEASLIPGVAFHLQKDLNTLYQRLVAEIKGE